MVVGNSKLKSELRNRSIAAIRNQILVIRKKYSLLEQEILNCNNFSMSKKELLQASNFIL